MISHSQQRRWTRSPLAVLLSFSLLLGFTGGQAPTSAQSTPGKINRLDLYAAFLTKFPHFVEWTARTQNQEQPQIRIGAIGGESFSDTTIHSIQSQTFNGKPIAFVKLKSIADIKDLHMLFVHESEHDQIDQISQAAKGTGILTFSATPQFCQRGGIITFVFKDGKTRFQINLRRASEEGIRISTKILRMASICE